MNHDQSLPQSTAQPGNKYAPGRRLAARQTLRLAIPKGDPLSNPHPVGVFRPSPSQLPPAPILKRGPTGSFNSSISSSSGIPKSASPLESHHLPNATPTRYGLPGAGSGGSGCSSAASATSNFLGVRKPSLTLNSSDIRNNNDLFAFPKDMSPVLSEHSHSPMFTDISSAHSNGSPTHHHQLGRLFSLSPSSIRSYGNINPRIKWRVAFMVAGPTQSHENWTQISLCRRFLILLRDHVRILKFSAGKLKCFV